jgi:hypothetical protein
MEASEIALLLGRPSNDPHVIAELARAGIDERPRAKIDENDADGPVIQSQDWLLKSAAGIEFGFDDEASWRGWVEFERGRHQMLLTQIYFYGKQKGVNPYGGRLPFGLALSDDRDIVRSKMMALESTRRSYVRDVWDSRDYRITVSYVDADAGIRFVLCALREPTLPAVDYSLNATVPIERIVGLLGKELDNGELREAFKSLGISRFIEDVREGRALDFRNSYGFELGFTRPASLEHRPPQSEVEPIFSYAAFYRERELDARGWTGTLPLGIQFDDSPEILMQKVGVQPDEQVDKEATGYALWHLPDFSLHVYYSTMENLLLRVRVVLPGLWAAWTEA